MARTYISYIRVSTDKQGRSGLGLDDQRAKVRALIGDVGWPPLKEFVEAESGKLDDRPQLRAALDACRLHGATLVVAKLDRLARSQRFLMEIVDSGVNVIFGDFPSIPEGAAGRFMVQQMASVAELEAGLISERTRAALAQAKARGTRLGNPNGAEPLRRAGKGNAAAVAKRQAQATERAELLRPVIDDIRAGGTTSANGIARELNARGVRTPRGRQWHDSSVRKVLAKMEAAAG